MSKRISIFMFTLVLILSFVSCSENKSMQPTVGPTIQATDIPETVTTHSPEETNTDSETILYDNPDFGITLEFPAHWKDKYVVEVVDNKLIVYSKNTMEWSNTRYTVPHGELFRIVRTEEDLSEEDLLSFDFRSKILLKTDTYTYYQMIGNGYEGPYPKEEYPELYEEYMQMFDESKSVLSSVGVYEP